MRHGVRLWLPHFHKVKHGRTLRRMSDWEPHGHVRGGAPVPGCPGCGGGWGKVVTAEEYGLLRRIEEAARLVVASQYESDGIATEAWENFREILDNSSQGASGRSLDAL